MFEKVAFTMYPVTDVARARKFYEEELGLKPGSHGSPDGKMWWIEYDLPGGGCFAISNATQSTPSAGAGGMIAFEVDDLEALVARLKKAGIVFKSDMIRGPRCRMSVCIDTEGNALLLHQLDEKKKK